MLKISPIPAFEDNYLWLLEREGYEVAPVELDSSRIGFDQS